MYEKYFNKLREECLIRNRSSRTADTYINNIRHFMKWTGYKPMEDLSLQDARSFILEKRNSGLSSATCNFYNSSICFLYKHVLHIPWDQDIVPRMRLDVKLPKVLSLEEIEKLINSATQIRNKAIIALLYSSGMRVGELVSLKPEDIYMSTMQVYISKGKNHRDRWTILSERALDLLKEYWRSYPVKREYLFVSLDAPHELLKVSGVVRIRHYGLLSCRNKKEKMAHCRKLLNCIQYISKLRGKTCAEKLMILYKKDICKCEACGGNLHSLSLRGRYMLT